MKNQSILYGIIGLLSGSLLTVLVTSTSVNNNYMPMMRMMGIQTSSIGNAMDNSDLIDAHFIEQMIPHHEDAISMAELAPTKAIHPEIKQLSQSIIESQGKEIALMKDWYQDWYGTEVVQDETVMGRHGMGQTTRTHMGMMGDETDMTRLEQATDFDRAFIEEMIPHHQMAVMMANMLKNSTQRKEMKKLAEDIIAAQTREIGEMRQWYENWGFNE